MKKNYLLKSVTVLSILSSVSVIGGNLSTAKAATNTPYATQNKQNAIQNKQAITFEDPAVKEGALLSLYEVLGRPASENDLTQENLNKVTKLAILGTTRFNTLNDVSKMPNLVYVGIQSTNIADVIDSKPLGELKNLKDFTFLQVGYYPSQLTSLSPLAGKGLENVIIHSMPVLDNSENVFSTMSKLNLLDVSYKENNKKAEVGNLDNLPNLTEIHLNGMNLSKAPTLKNSNQLEYVNFSDNNITSVPDLPQNENLWYVGMDRNSIKNYDNVKELIQSPSHPSISLQSNLLTSLPPFELPGLKKLDLSGNFIINKGLDYQHTIKPIPAQSVNVGQQKEINVGFEDENGHPLMFDLTNQQKEFLSLDNMSVETSNDNVTIEKGQNSISIKANKKGNTTVSLAYQGELKTEFNVEVN